MSGVRIALAVVGIFIGAGIVGISYNNKLSSAWAILTGNTPLINPANPAHDTKQPPTIHFTPGELNTF